LLKVQ